MEACNVGSWRRLMTEDHKSGGVGGLRWRVTAAGHNEGLQWMLVTEVCANGGLNQQDMTECAG